MAHADKLVQAGSLLFGSDELGQWYYHILSHNFLPSAEEVSSIERGAILQSCNAEIQ